MREKVIAALEESDKLRRDARADRLEWLSLHNVTAPMVVGRAETLRLLEEAKCCFVDGHFVAALMIAMAFIEHTIVEDLQTLGHVKDSPRMSVAIELAKEKKTFPPDWLERAKKLTLRRNPFAHLKKSGHTHSLGTRIMEEGRHPIAIMESDAKDAMDLMYNFFTMTLREIDPEKLWPGSD